MLFRRPLPNVAKGIVADRPMMPFSSTLSHRSGNRQKHATRAIRSQEEDKSAHPESIFSPQKSAWDHVFTDLKEMPPLLPSAVQNPLRSPSSSSNARARRQTMTAREIRAFDEMFNMIFNAVSEQKITSEPMTRDRDSSSNIDIGKSGMINLFGKLRRHSKRMKWTTEADDILDRQKEEMDLCDTDQQLLEWAGREVFGEHEQYEAAPLKAASGALASAPSQELPMLQSPTYPHLIALLMRTFRDKYLDPNLALAIFDHARRLSIASYVFGCSTQAYNELIETRWKCFRDLKGVYDALEEMKVNGVDIDARTRKLADGVRRQAGKHGLWAEENNAESWEVWDLLTKIEHLISTPVKRPSKELSQSSNSRTLKWDDWKSMPLETDSNDEWEFDQWDKPKLRKGREVKVSRYR